MSNISLMKHLGACPQLQATITPSNLPYCLTKEYQGIVAKIQSSDNPHRGEGKKTGIWCPKECED